MLAEWDVETDLAQPLCRKMSSQLTLRAREKSPRTGSVGQSEPFSDDVHRLPLEMMQDENLQLGLRDALSYEVMEKSCGFVIGDRSEWLALLARNFERVGGQRDCLGIESAAALQDGRAGLSAQGVHPGREAALPLKPTNASAYSDENFLRAVRRVFSVSKKIQTPSSNALVVTAKKRFQASSLVFLSAIRLTDPDKIHVRVWMPLHERSVALDRQVAMTPGTHCPLEPCRRLGEANGDRHGEIRERDRANGSWDPSLRSWENADPTPSGVRRNSLAARALRTQLAVPWG